MVCISYYKSNVCKTVKTNVKAGRNYRPEIPMTTTKDNLRLSYFMQTGCKNELFREQLAQHVPSAYAEKPFSGTSNRYAFFPTDNVVEALRESGWAPVIAQEQRARAQERFGFQKHLIRFHQRHELGRAVLHDSRLELVLMNSHDGGCAFRLFAGVFRLVCANGLIVSEASFGAISIRHTNRTIEQVADAAQKIARTSEGIGGRIDAFRQRVLSDEERTDFASRALALRYDSADEAPVRPSFLLEPNRREDHGRSLWQTFNVIQERMMRGSRPDRFKALREGRRSARVRGLTGLDAQLTINRNLWALASSYLN
jgi:hypothetical protein